MQNHKQFISTRGYPLFKDIDLCTNQYIYRYEKNIICGILFGVLIVIIVYYNYNI